MFVFLFPNWDFKLEFSFANFTINHAPLTYQMIVIFTLISSPHMQNKSTHIRWISINHISAFYGNISCSTLTSAMMILHPHFAPDILRQMRVSWTSNPTFLTHGRLRRPRFIAFADVYLTCSIRWCLHLVLVFFSADPHKPSTRIRDFVSCISYYSSLTLTFKPTTHHCRLSFCLCFY